MKVKLSDIFKLQMGKTPSRDNLSYWGGSNKWISIADIGNAGKYIDTTKECISDEGVAASGIKQVPRGTVIMSFKLSIGKTAITAEDMYTNEAIMAFIDRHIVEISPDYIYYLFSSMDWTPGTNKAVMGLTLNKAAISQKEVNIPSLKSQLRVVDVLDKISGCISLRKRQLAKLDELVKARFVELFGDNQDMPRHKLSEISDVGSSKRVFVDELKKEGIPFFRGTEIGMLAEGTVVEPELFISQEHYNELKIATGIPVMGDLLMPSICPDGRIWQVNNSNPFYFKDGRVLWVHINSQQVNSTYLLYALKNIIPREYDNIASGTTFAELKIFALKDLRITIPSLDLQERFAAFVHQSEKLRLTIRKGLDKLETLKRALMQEYFKTYSKRP